MYRFLLTRRWLGGAAVTLVAAAVMVLLGNWQFDRYTERTRVNERIDAAERTAPVPVGSLLPRPGAPGTAGAAPAPEVAWSRVTATGRYDPANEVLVRTRTVAGRVGYEVVTPLLLPDGTAVLVDRGWVPPAPGGATAVPAVPAAPAGEVTVIGRVHLSESRGGTVERRDGRLQARRVDVPTLARHLPYPVYGAYLLAAEPVQAGMVAIPVQREGAWQNGGYAVQWWVFAVLALVGYGWLARREARGDADRTPVDRVDPVPAP